MKNIIDFVGKYFSGRYSVHRFKIASLLKKASLVDIGFGARGFFGLKISSFSTIARFDDNTLCLVINFQPMQPFFSASKATFAISARPRLANPNTGARNIKKLKLLHIRQTKHSKTHTLGDIIITYRNNNSHTKSNT